MNFIILDMYKLYTIYITKNEISVYLQSWCEVQMKQKDYSFRLELIVEITLIVGGGAHL